MNERIKQLVAQAEDYASEHEEHWHDGPDWQELFSTKFAELIIRECANLNFRGTGEVTTEGEGIIGDLILKHFGVE